MFLKYLKNLIDASQKLFDLSYMCARSQDCDTRPLVAPIYVSVERLIKDLSITASRFELQDFVNHRERYPQNKHLSQHLPDQAKEELLEKITVYKADLESYRDVLAGLIMEKLPHRTGDIPDYLVDDGVKENVGEVLELAADISSYFNILKGKLMD